jgi:predicted HTH domain antitoxin
MEFYQPRQSAFSSPAFIYNPLSARFWYNRFAERGKREMKTVLMDVKLPEAEWATAADLKITLAAKLYENGRLSLGQAAESAGLTKRTFAELLGLHEVSLFSQTAEELMKDIANA